MTRPCALACTALFVGFLSTPAQAAPILEQTLIATGGDVVVTFVSKEAEYTSELFLDGRFGDELGTIFNSWTTELGTSMNLGTFADGTELIFKLLVKQTGDIFYTGPGDRNRDGVPHAMTENVAGQVFVGFEDLFGGGDLDYNDVVFAFTNVTLSDQPATTDSSEDTPGVGDTPASLDEPGTLLMLGSGLLMLFLG